MGPGQRIFIAIILFVAIVLIGHVAFSVVTSNGGATSDIGAHTPLLKVEKNENPQNLMVVYTKLDPKTCSFETKSGKPVLDEYWLMNGERYKRVNPLIKNAVSDRFELDQKAFSSAQKFLVHLRDFHELKSDLGSEPTFEVRTAKADGGCRTDVLMRLGPSDHGRQITIDSIYAASSKKMLPPFRQLKSLTLNGKDVATGEAVHRTYSAN